MGICRLQSARRACLAALAAGCLAMPAIAQVQRQEAPVDPLQVDPDAPVAVRRSQALPSFLRGTVGTQADQTSAASTAQQSGASPTDALGANDPNPVDPTQVRPSAPPVPRTSAVVQAPVLAPLRPQTTPPVQTPVLDPRAATSGGAPIAPPPQPVVPPPPDPTPFAPLGITLGSFTLRPAIETGVGFSDNANGTTTNQTRTGFTRNAAELLVNSNWSNHALGLRLRYEREDFFTSQVDARNNIDIQATGRIDVTRNTQIDVGGGFRRQPDSAFTFNLPVTTTGRPDLDTTTANVALTQRLGRFSVRLRGQFDQLRYGDTNLVGGGTLSNRSRNLDVTTLTLRGTYDITPSFSPFAEIAYNQRTYEVPIDPFGLRQGSDGLTPRAGIALNFGPALTGEVAAGYLFQRQREPTIPRVEGFTVDGLVSYQLSGLTTLRFNARSGVLDSQQIGGSTGGFTRDLFFTIEHAFRRNLIATATLNLGLDQFAGVVRTDKRLMGILALTWRLNRNVSFTTRYVYSRVDSNVAGVTQAASSIEGGLRIEY